MRDIHEPTHLLTRGKELPLDFEAQRKLAKEFECEVRGQLDDVGRPAQCERRGNLQALQQGNSCMALPTKEELARYCANIKGIESSLLSHTLASTMCVAPSRAEGLAPQACVTFREAQSEPEQDQTLVPTAFKLEHQTSFTTQEHALKGGTRCFDLDSQLLACTSPRPLGASVEVTSEGLKDRCLLEHDKILQLHLDNFVEWGEEETVHKLLQKCLDLTADFAKRNSKRGDVGMLLIDIYMYQTSTLEKGFYWAQVKEWLLEFYLKQSEQFARMLQKAALGRLKDMHSKQANQYAGYMLQCDVPHLVRLYLNQTGQLAKLLSRSELKLELEKVYLQQTNQLSELWRTNFGNSLEEMGELGAYTIDLQEKQKDQYRLIFPGL